MLQLERKRRSAPRSKEGRKKKAVGRRMPPRTPNNPSNSHNIPSGSVSSSNRLNNNSN